MGHNGVVNNETKWVNQFQPQTLVIATFLLYINAFFWVINLIQGFPPEIAVLAAVAMGLGGWGVANEKRWAYILAIFGAVLNVGWPYLYGMNTDIISLMFGIALVVLLVHPMSRDYQRIWFK